MILKIENDLEELKKKLYLLAYERLTMLDRAKTIEKEMDETTGAIKAFDHVVKINKEVAAYGTLLTEHNTKEGEHPKPGVGESKPSQGDTPTTTVDTGTNGTKIVKRKSRGISRRSRR